MSLLDLKNSVLFLAFILISIHISAQKKVIKKISLTNEEVEINTDGLDDLILENSDSKFLEVYLFAEAYDEQLVQIKKNDQNVIVSFKFQGTETREVVFRKFITKRLQRANAVVKIPKGKKVFIFGENVDITSKSIQNNLAIYIDNGIIKLNVVKQNLDLQLFSGNVFATLFDSNIEVKSNIGRIKINNKLSNKNYKSENKKWNKRFYVNSIKANLFITKTNKQ